MKPKITLTFRNDDIDCGYLVEKVIVLIDVLGSTSIISHALELGAAAVHIKHDELGARRYARSLESRHGLYMPCKPLDQYDGAREEPLLPAMPRLNGKQLIISSSCSYAASQMATGARHVYAAALLNAPAVVRQLQQHDDYSITFVCMNSCGEMSLIDLYAAGYMIDQLNIDRPGAWSHAENAKVALAVYQRYQDDPLNCLNEGRRSKILNNRKISEAARFVTCIGTHDNVPEQRSQCVFSDNRVNGFTSGLEDIGRA